MNNYYTPEIEELKVGFELEVKDDYGWDKYIIRDTDSFLEFDLDINFPDTRVKILDKEDIESLGWGNYVKSITEWFSIKRRFKSLHFSKDYYYSQVKLNFDKKNKSIQIIGIAEEDNEPYSLFRGTIKNKSELEVLMKQLNIK